MEVDNETATMEVWNRETVPTVVKIVCSRLPQRDLISFLLVSPWVHRNLIAHPWLWLVLDFHEMDKAGDRLEAALSLSRYQNVKQIKLEFAQDIEYKYLEIVRNMCRKSIGNLEVLNLNGCQKISDAYNGPKLKDFSIYWNNVSDESLKLISKYYQGLLLLNITRCSIQEDFTFNSSSIFRPLWRSANCKSLISLNLKWCVCITDQGVISIAQGCTFLEFLSLFGIVGVTDKSLEALSGCCSNTMTTLDVNGCIAIKRQSRGESIQLFPKLKFFKVHS